MERQQDLDYQQEMNYQQEPGFNQSPILEETVVSPPPPPPIDNSYVQPEDAPVSTQPNWMTEPFIRVNWKRIGYTINIIFNKIGSFFSERWAAFQEGRRSAAASSGEPLQQPEQQQNVPPMSGAASQQQAPEPETPFGYVDRRQARMQQSFSRNFDDSGAIPVPPSNPNYSQQRIDQSFTNSFRENENKQS